MDEQYDFLKKNSDPEVKYTVCEHLGIAKQGGDSKICAACIGTLYCAWSWYACASSMFCQKALFDIAFTSEIHKCSWKIPQICPWGDHYFSHGSCPARTRINVSRSSLHTAVTGHWDLEERAWWRMPPLLPSKKQIQEYHCACSWRIQGDMRIRSKRAWAWIYLYCWYRSHFTRIS